MLFRSEAEDEVVDDGVDQADDDDHDRAPHDAARQLGGLAEVEQVVDGAGGEAEAVLGFRTNAN